VFTKLKLARALVVDSNDSTMRTFRRLLKKQGFDADVAISSKEALQKMNRQNYSLVLISSPLPDIDGIDLLLFMQKSLPKALKIVTSGFPFAETSVRAIEAGADAVFAKPVSPNELFKIIHKLQEQEERNR
jgi:DNA-binding response OmpR family regulator